MNQDLSIILDNSSPDSKGTFLNWNYGTKSTEWNGMKTTQH